MKNKYIIFIESLYYGLKLFYFKKSYQVFKSIKSNRCVMKIILLSKSKVNKKSRINSNSGVQHCIELILKARARDSFHINNPLRQIKTLSFLVNELLKDNKDGKNDSLIGFYANIGRSLKQLIDYQNKSKF